MKMTNTQDKAVAVLIPVHRQRLESHEAMALEQCFRILGRHPIIAIAPASLEFDYLKGRAEVITFDPGHFTSAKSFSKLQLTGEFYGTFSRYRHILMYQLDAFVFRDELLHWCSQDFDYVGAPWLNAGFPVSFQLRQSFPWWLKVRWRLGLDRGGRVGNGGFSLRKVSTCAAVLRRLAKFAAQWPYNQDIFWAVAAPNFCPRFKIPSVEKALEFAFEVDPRECFLRNGSRLPFGCHAWMKYDTDFWRGIFREHGYTI